MSGPMIVRPVTTEIYGLTPCKGLSSSLSSQLAPTPVFAGTQRDGMMPLPKNPVPSRTGNSPPAAYAVPLSFSMPTRRGSGTATAMPPPTVPWSRARREMIVRFERAMSLWSFSLRLVGFDEPEWIAGDQGQQELVSLVAAGGETGRQRVQDGGVGLHGFAALRVHVDLADEAGPADGCVAQHRPHLGQAVERRTVQVAGGVDGVTVLQRPVLADGIEVLQAEAQRIHQRMAGVAARGGPVQGEPRAHRRRRIAGRRQLWNHAGRRRRDGLAQQRLADVLAALGGPRPLRQGQPGQDGAAAQNACARRVGR